MWRGMQTESLCTLTIMLGSHAFGQCPPLIQSGPMEPNSVSGTVASAGDLDHDGVPDVAYSAGGAFGSSISGVTVVSGRDGTIIRTFPAIDATSRQFGAAIAVYSDRDGDGDPEYLVGDPEDDLVRPGGGRAYLISGRTGGVLLALDPVQNGGFLGRSVVACSDLDDDGMSDFAAGAPGGNECSVTLFSGSDGHPIWTAMGETAALFGTSLTGTDDHDGDGIDDLIVGAPGAGAFGNGQVLIVSGRTGQTILIVDGQTTRGDFGWSVAALDDINSDDVADLVVGDPKGGLSGQGEVSVLSGLDGSFISAALGNIRGSQFGLRVAPAGDFNQDGVPDYLVGAPFDDVGQGPNGAVRAFSGSTGLPVYTVTGTMGMAVGYDVSLIGDIDLDGRPDVAAVSLGDDVFGINTGTISLYSADCNANVLYVSLDQPRLVSGQFATLTVVNAPARSTVYLVYGFTGYGTTPVPPLGVVLRLNEPTSYLSLRSNSQGTSSLRFRVPSSFPSSPVYFQATTPGRTSNVLPVGIYRN